MPTLASPGVMMPGLVGPISQVSVSWAYSRTSITSWTGMCSVMTTMSLMPALMLWMAASLTASGGTKKTEASAPVRAMASLILSNTGTPSTTSPPLPGDMPPTTFVP